MLAVGAYVFPPVEDMTELKLAILWVAVGVHHRLGRSTSCAAAGGRPRVRVDVLAIGTELLLGQIVDTNSSWIGEQLAAVGIDTMEHRKVGDNLGRMVAAMREMLEHADAVVVCGGIGPTQDDVTRDAIAEVMGVELERREELVDHIASLFGTRGRDMPQNNLRQADVPRRRGRRSRTRSAPRPGSGPRSAARSSTRCRASRTRCS